MASETLSEREVALLRESALGTRFIFLHHASMQRDGPARNIFTNYADELERIVDRLYPGVTVTINREEGK